MKAMYIFFHDVKNLREKFLYGEEPRLEISNLYGHNSWHGAFIICVVATRDT